MPRWAATQQAEMGTVVGGVSAIGKVASASALFLDPTGIIRIIYSGLWTLPNSGYRWNQCHASTFGPVGFFSVWFRGGVWMSRSVALAVLCYLSLVWTSCSGVSVSRGTALPNLYKPAHRFRQLWVEDYHILVLIS